MHSFQNPIYTAPFCRSLSRLFFACVHHRYDVANSKLLQTFKFVTIKFKTMLLEFLYLRSLVVSDLRSETKGSRFQFGCNLCAEVLSVQ